jgi:DNA (cytosine-5)-methyltransferase 1
MSKKPTAIDLFCGAGGLSEGFRQSGFQIIAGIDHDQASAETFKKAHSNASFFRGSIEDFPAKTVRNSLSIKKGELDCLIGGPPCQAYSINNHNRGLKDKRSQLFHRYLDYVKEFSPKWIVIENVTGILSISNGKPVTEIKNKLVELGYNLELNVLKAEYYGVPQLRRRVFIVGTRTEAKITWPKITNGTKNKPFVTVAEAILDLPNLKNGEKHLTKKYSLQPKTNFQKYVRKNSTELVNHETNMLGKLNLLRMKHVKPGGSWRDIPRSLLPDGMKRAKSSDHTKRYGRLHLNGLASTILTKCDLHWGCYIHPTQNRVISVREAARFQSFPDHYEFLGSRTEQYMQIGNAVPPLLAKAVAAGIKKSLSAVKTG